MKINKLKMIGAMVFITILMDVVPNFGFLRIGDISVTNLLIPPILTSILLGPAYGMIPGAVFGLISLMRAVSRGSTILDLLLQNPLISVVPRMLFPLISGYLFLLFKKIFSQKFSYVSVMVSSFTGAVFNGILVLMPLYAIYPQELASIFPPAEGTCLLDSVLHAFAPNVLTESFACMLICTLCVWAIQKKDTKKSD